MIKYATMYLYVMVWMDRHSIEAARRIYHITNRMHLWKFGHDVSEALAARTHDIILCVMHHSHPLVYEQLRLPNEEQTLTPYMTWMCTFVRYPKETTCRTCGQEIEVCRRAIPQRVQTRAMACMGQTDPAGTVELADLLTERVHSHG